MVSGEVPLHTHPLFANENGIICNVVAWFVKWTLNIWFWNNFSMETCHDYIFLDNANSGQQHNNCGGTILCQIRGSEIFTWRQLLETNLPVIIQRDIFTQPNTSDRGTIIAFTVAELAAVVVEIDTKTLGICRCCHIDASRCFGVSTAPQCQHSRSICKKYTLNGWVPENIVIYITTNTSWNV